MAFCNVSLGRYNWTKGVVAMSPTVEEATVRNYPHLFVDRKNELIIIKRLDESLHQALIKKYLAFQPRDSFEGLPPIEDEACVKWVWKTIHDGCNLVALTSEGDIVGHAAIFFIDQPRCEMLTVVWPQFRNRGIGTELVRCCIIAHEMGFEKIWFILFLVVISLHTPDIDFKNRPHLVLCPGLLNLDVPSGYRREPSRSDSPPLPGSSCHRLAPIGLVVGYIDGIPSRAVINRPYIIHHYLIEAAGVPSYQ